MNSPDRQGTILLRAFAAVALLAAWIGCSGCGAFYRNQVQTSDYTLYTDLHLGKTKTAQQHIRDTMRAFRPLFPDKGAAVEAPTVICSEDRLAAREIYTSDFKQEGYYLPLFSLVHLTRQFPSDGGEEERSIVLHELTHHFLISTMPETRSLYWLNEGLACCLEVSFFDDQGELRTPLYHPWLHRQGRRSMQELGADGLADEAEALLECSWLQFHRGENKTRNYALSWALTYRLLERFEGSIESRVRAILALSRGDLREVARSLPAWLTQDPEEMLEQLAADPHFSDWALERWLRMDRIDPARLLPRIDARVSGADTSEERCSASRHLLAFLGRRPHALDPAVRERLQGQVRAWLARGEKSLALAICRSMQPEARSRDFLAPLIALLESPDADLRVAAAQALARVTNKPTITRPDFWRSAGDAERDAEIGEWRGWLAAVQGEPTAPAASRADAPQLSH